MRKLKVFYGPRQNVTYDNSFSLCSGEEADDAKVELNQTKLEIVKKLSSE